MVKRPSIVRRRGERGAALFIVVLVILSLTGVALFAARSASMDVAIAGRFKQAGETRQIARIGLALTLHELGRDPETYVRAMSDPNTFGGAGALGNVCAANVTATPGNPTGCYRFAYDGLETAINQDLGNPSYTPPAAPSFWVIQPGNTTTSQPGSIGFADVRPNFSTEMTDKIELSYPIAGYQNGSGSNMRFYSVTLSGTGEILPRDAGAAAGTWGPLNPATAAGRSFMASVSATRAMVTVGPLPQGI